MAPSWFNVSDNGMWLLLVVVFCKRGGKRNKGVGVSFYNLFWWRVFGDLLVLLWCFLVVTVA